MKKEGDLYKIVNVFDSTFELYYGYYDENDRLSKYNDPIPIYPDFRKHPVYTKNCFPFVTEMQDACIYYKGRRGEDTCFYCESFKRGQELIGLCLNENNMNNIKGEKI